MTANPVTAQDALDLEALRKEITECYALSFGEPDPIKFALNYIAASNLLAQPRNDAEAVRNLVNALDQVLDDLSAGTMKFPGHGVCEQVWNEAIAALQSAQKEGG